jgi:hypothetical protein
MPRQRSATRRRRQCGAEPTGTSSALERWARAAGRRWRGAAGGSGAHARLEPVSGESRTSLFPRREFLPGKSLARAETVRAILATLADSGRQRPRYPAPLAAKPRKVKDYSDRAGKPELRRTAWWSWQDSNQQTNDYGGGASRRCFRARGPASYAGVTMRSAHRTDGRHQPRAVVDLRWRP